MTDPNRLDWPVPQDVEIVYTTEEDVSVLTPDERARLATFGHAGRRRQFVLGRTAARTLAARRLGCAPAAVPLVVGADGAPHLDGAFVSIAHGGRGAAAVGVAALADRAVGVDVEAVGPRRPDLWTRILRPDERPLLDALGGPTDDVQTLLWTLKESVLKAQRTGFRAGGRSVRLALDVEAGTASAASRHGRWRLAFRPLDGLWLAVAWSESPGYAPKHTP